MPISSISTIFIHNHAPVMENTTILKNAGKQHFAGVSDNNRNQSYFIGVFLQTTPIVQKFSTVSIELIQLIRAYTLHIVWFFVNTISPHSVNPIYYHLLNYPYYTISYHIIYYTRYHIQYNYIDIQILLLLCNIL